jgi:hypothetical protein
MPEHLGHNGHIVIASQIVRDVKVGGGKTRERLGLEIGKMRTGFREKNYIPGDKLNCQFRPLQMEGDRLVVEIYGGMLRGSDADDSLDPHFHQKFSFDLHTPVTPEQMNKLSLEDLLVQHCSDVTVDDGGNAQNMAMNLCLAGISSLRDRLKLTVFSTSDPLKRMPDAIREAAEPMLRYHKIASVPDRIAIHLPWQYEDGRKGTFGLTTEPVDISTALSEMIRSNKELMNILKTADCFVTCDPSYVVLSHYGRAGRFTTMVNTATKWRTAVAHSAYQTAIVLPMNHKEAADVAHVIRHVGAEEELHKIKRIPFPSPLQPNGAQIHAEHLRHLDELLLELTRYNPTHHRPNGLVAFNYPITFEEHGGLVVGTRDRRSVVAYTSTPDERAEKNLLSEFGDRDQIHEGDIETMGAGDAAASIIALFNAVDPQEFIRPILEGRETGNHLLHQMTQTIFVSALSRIVGSFLIHTKKTHLANVKLSMFGELFNRVAKESLDVARNIVQTPNEEHIQDLPSFGIKAVIWTMGNVVNPDV